MNTFFPNILYSFLLSLFIFSSCSKTQDPAPTPVGDLKIRLTMPNATPGRNSYELIISEPGGKVLLDTTSLPAVEVVASLKTNVTLVDVTNVYYDDFAASYYVVTYKAVDPSTWTTAFNGSYHAPVGGPVSNVPAEMFYTQIPSTNSIMFSNCTAEPPSSFTIDGSAKTLDVFYNLHAGNYACATWPNEKKYSIHIPNGPHDTVDCSKLDTSAELSITHSPLYNFSHSRLIGILDTTDYTRSLFLYDYYANPLFTLPEMLYPPKIFQTYELFTDWISGNKESISAYSYGNKPNGQILYPDNSQYSITSSQNNHFSVTFTTAMPTYYTTNWRTNKINWTLYASPDSMSLDPLSMLSAQKSKFLQGQDLGALKISSFQFEWVQGFDYTGYLFYTCNPTAVKTKRVPNAVSYTKIF